MLILQTPRLTLRRLQPGDLDALAALYADEETRRHFPRGTLTRDQTQEELEWHRHGHPDDPRLGLWATIERSSGALIGRCGLLPWTLDGVDEIEVAYLIDRSRWGQGLAGEAAQGIVEYAHGTLGIDRLIALIKPGNIASARVAEKIGMRHERDYQHASGPCRLYSRTR
ncbi:GNAT family N-acetyltransferase [Pseudoxanthomonas putridarboris]|uniref:GNAT family N-acetyltransferase n=1 Tax=Pseudoxanthomonas putridarboris TaxID=752605 RepID=A0ABU9J074_9GAMM